MLLEVCVASIDDAIAAVGGGADRLELNSALELGGLTPTVTLLEEVKRETSIPLMTMVRPRAAGFCYSLRERLTMLRDAERLLAAGADGIVFGILTATGCIDLESSAQLAQLGQPRETVFHRAFDVLKDRSAALEQLIDMGVTRALTSGGAVTAIDGCAAIAQLQQQARGRITIMPGAGIRLGNVLEVVRKTGCRQIHGSFRSELIDNAGPVAAATYGHTDIAKVRAVRELLTRVASSAGSS